MTSTPTVLRAQDFSRYPPQGHALALQHLGLLREVPLPLLPILLREIASYDWKFPRERERLTGQLGWLQSIGRAEREVVFHPFSDLQLPPELGKTDWINDSADYVEQLTAALWSTGGMPAFREASQHYAGRMQQAVPESRPALPRLAIVVLDAELQDQHGGARFEMLRKRGVLLTGIDPREGATEIAERVAQRSLQGPAYAHWWIDGGAATEQKERVTTVSYAALEPVRQQLLARAKHVINRERSGPEELRSMMARLSPSDVGLAGGGDVALTHFQLSLLAEGSGTQVFSTTFVQWAARECLRRAEPETILLRYRPRQRQQGMNELLSGAAALGTDPAGSLIDAEQGAYYTYINLQRLAGAEQACFLAWQEGSTEAVAVGPGFARGTTSPVRRTMRGVLDLLT